MYYEEWTQCLKKNWPEMSDLDSELPPASEQVRIIKDLDSNTTLTVGEDAYMISLEWFKKWKIQAKYYGTPDDASFQSPGPINNQNLLLPSGKIKQSIDEIHDYNIMTKQVWEKLHGWYGGGPVIKLPVYNSKEGPVAVFKILILNCHYKDEKVYEVETHYYAEVGDLRKKIMDHYGLSKDHETRLIDYFQKKPISSKVMDDDKQLSDYQMYNNQDIMLDYKTEDDIWKLDEMKAKIKEATPITQSTNSSSYRYGYYNSYDHPATEPGAVGFSNLGNTCFFNSGTQCLVHSNPLVKCFLYTNWEKDLNPGNPIGMKGRLASAFADLVKKVWSGTTSVISPRDLKFTIGEFAPQFSGWGQQDSHELITFMLDGIHEDLNRRKHKEIVEGVSGDGTNDEETAIKAWKNHLVRNDSIIVDNFHGQLRSQLTCPKCKQVTVVFDPYVALSLPIQKPKTKDLSIQFVPYDFAEPYKTIRLNVSLNATFEELSAMISSQLNRKVNVIVATLSRAQTLSWGIKDSVYKQRYLAFEIPDPDKFYACCFVASSKSSYGYYTKLYGDPFLVELETSTATNEEIAEAAEVKLKCIWEEPEDVIKNKQIDQSLRDLEISLPKNDEDIPITKEKLTATIKGMSTSLDPKLTPHKVFNFVSDNIVHLKINEYYTTKKSGFEPLSLLRHEQPFDTGNDDDIDNAGVTLKQCFDFFSTTETLDADNQWYCPNCKEFVCADKKMDIWSASKCLIIQLKRFTGGQYSTRKLDTYVNFPDEIDMSEFVIGPQKRTMKGKMRYRLYAVSEHMGGLGGGHYTAHAIVVQKGHVKGKWYSFNDSSCTESDRRSAHSSSAYVLFYERIDPDMHSDEESTYQLLSNSADDTSSDEN